MQKLLVVFGLVLATFATVIAQEQQGKKTYVGGLASLRLAYSVGSNTGSRVLSHQVVTPSAGRFFSIQLQPYYLIEQENGRTWGLGASLGYSYQGNALRIFDNIRGTTRVFDARRWSAGVTAFYRHSLLPKSSFSLFLQPSTSLNWENNNSASTFNCLLFNLGWDVGTTIDLNDRLRLVVQSNFATLGVEYWIDDRSFDYDFSLLTQTTGIRIGVEMLLPQG